MNDMVNFKGRKIERIKAENSDAGTLALVNMMLKEAKTGYYFTLTRISADINHMELHQGEKP